MMGLANPGGQCHLWQKVENTPIPDRIGLNHRSQPPVKTDSMRSPKSLSASRRTEAPMLPRLILADDHTILVEAFRKLLEPHCNIIATVSNGRALMEIAKELNPEVIVVDIG